MLNQVEFFNSRGIGVYFTFSNNILTPHHLQDEICNRVLKMFENPLNGVIISSPILYEHVKKIAPKYKTIFSLTNVVYDKNRLLNIANDYDLIVIPPEFNTDIAFLKQFPPEKIELVINESCVPYCKYKKEHYTFFAKKYLGLLKSERAYICRHNFERETMVLSMKNMREIMIATNISCFKLVSRVPYYEAIKIFSTYFVKEEYAETFCIYMKGLCLNSKT
ncbi:MAG: hypothetical protein LBE13_22465 [Bacteroidales bacterium]|jgi:hypothetical protein|nr:hypothetical protein [Bacteroidales bacterium]